MVFAVFPMIQSDNNQEYSYISPRTRVTMNTVEGTACALFQNLHSPQYQVGIDTLFYKTDTYVNFQGIKLIPPGCHLIHITDTINSSRVGRFVNAKSGTVILISLEHSKDAIDSIFIKIETVELQNGVQYGITEEMYVSKMANYQSGIEEFGIDPKSIMDGFDYRKYLSNDTGNVTSEDATTLEIRKLDEAIMKRRNTNERDRKYMDDLTTGLKRLNENTLKMSVIDISDKKTLVKAESKNKMEDYLDRTWIIEKEFNQGVTCDFMQRYLAEFKFSFILAAILNNQGAYQQWKTLLDLFLRSGRLLKQQKSESYEFLKNVNMQLKILLRLRKKDDYQEDADDTFNIDLSELQESFMECLLTVDELEDTKFQFLFGSIVQILNSSFGMEICDRLDMSE